MGYLIDGILGLAIGGLTVITGAMEGKLSLKFIDGWVFPWSALFGLAIAAGGGILWAFGQQGEQAKGGPSKQSNSLTRFGYELATGGLAAGVTTTVIAGGGHLALMALPDFLFDPNSDMPKPEEKKP